MADWSRFMCNGTYKQGFSHSAYTSLIYTRLVLNLNYVHKLHYESMDRQMYIVCLFCTYNLLPSLFLLFAPQINDMHEMKTNTSSHNIPVYDIYH